jgi:hypothetical protein
MAFQEGVSYNVLSDIVDIFSSPKLHKDKTVVDRNSHFLVLLIREARGSKSCQETSEVHA